MRMYYLLSIIFFLFLYMCLVIKIVPNCIYMVASFILTISLSISFPLAFNVHFWCASPTLSAPTVSWHPFPVQPQRLHWQINLWVPAGPMPSLPLLPPFPNWDETHLVLQMLPSRLTKEPQTQLRGLEALTPWGIHSDQW